jgi:signal peptidase
VLRGIGLVLSWLVIVVVVGGATPYTILTGSMRPHYPPGTLVVVKPVAAAAVALGAVITYQIHSGKPEVVTHRVVQVGQDASGEPRWRTQGDANAVPDPGWVLPVQVKGELWYAVPFLGRANLILTGQQRQTAVVAVAVMLFGYAGALWFGAARDRMAA